MDKVETSFITITGMLIVALFIAVAYEQGVASMKKEAIERNFAHYDVRSNGDTEFRWNNSAQ